MRRLKCLVALFATTMLAGCANGTSGDRLNGETQLSDNSFSAAYPIPESLAEIENQSEQIILAEMMNVENYGELSEDGTLTATITELEVADVFSGTVAKGEKVRVSEPYHFNLESLTTIGNYLPMDEGEEYLLFLSNYDGETWMIDYMGFGKYSPEKRVGTESFSSFSTYSDIEEFDFLSDEEYELERYTIIREEVFEKYIE